MASFWNHSEPGTDEGEADNFYLKLFKKNLQLALDMSFLAFRFGNGA